MYQVVEYYLKLFYRTITQLIQHAIFVFFYVTLLTLIYKFRILMSFVSFNLFNEFKNKYY